MVKEKDAPVPQCRLPAPARSEMPIDLGAARVRELPAPGRDRDLSAVEFNDLRIRASRRHHTY
jgi:hypothetical protein